MGNNEEKFKKMIEDVFLLDDEYNEAYGPDEITTWDSLATIALAAAIEKYFKVELNIRELIQIRNIGNIKTCLRNKGIQI